MAIMDELRMLIEENGLYQIDIDSDSVFIHEDTKTPPLLFFHHDLTDMMKEVESNENTETVGA